MTDFDAKIILAYAEAGMRPSCAAKIAYCNKCTVYKHFGYIEMETGLNPRNFYDLIELVKMAKEVAFA